MKKMLAGLLVFALIMTGVHTPVYATEAAGATNAAENSVQDLDAVQMPDAAQGLGAMQMPDAAQGLGAMQMPDENGADVTAETAKTPETPENEAGGVTSGTDGEKTEEKSQEPESEQIADAPQDQGSESEITEDADDQEIGSEQEAKAEQTLGEPDGSEAPDEVEVEQDPDEMFDENEAQPYDAGLAGDLEIKSVECVSRSYDEIVLRLTAEKDGIDLTKINGQIYYEICVTPKEGDGQPVGSMNYAGYRYIKKLPDESAQTAAVRVNDWSPADTDAPASAWEYTFNVRMVVLADDTLIDDPERVLASGLAYRTAGSALTKMFSTRGVCFVEKALGFTAAKTTVLSGEQNVRVGTVTAKNSSYNFKNFQAIAHKPDGGDDSYGDVNCKFNEGSSDLIVSVNGWAYTGKWKIDIYACSEASNAEDVIYEGMTTVTLTVQPGIARIDTFNIRQNVAVYDKDVIFNAFPVGYGGIPAKKAKYQKFTWEIKSATKGKDEDGYDEYTTIEPTQAVKECVQVSSKGKVTIKKSFKDKMTGPSEYIAIVIKAADFDGNPVYDTVYVEVTGTYLVPARIEIWPMDRYRYNYYEDDDGDGFTESAHVKRDTAPMASSDKQSSVTMYTTEADGAFIYVYDQAGNIINDKVTLTPAKGNAYINNYGDEANLWLRKKTSFTIKATSKDGGNKSVKIKVNTKYPIANELLYWIDIYINGIWIPDIDTNIDRRKGQVTLTAPKDGLKYEYSPSVMLGTTKSGKNVGDDKINLYNCQYRFKGGSAKKVDTKNGRYHFMVTPKARTFTLINKDKTQRRWSGQVNVTNYGWSSPYTAPRITQRDGKFYNMAYGTNKTSRQTMTFSFDSGTYSKIRIFPKGKSAGINIDYDATDLSKGTFVLEFYGSGWAKPGTYAYFVQFGDSSGRLVTKPATIKIKINKSSPVKVASSYTLDLSTGNKVALKSTPADFTPVYEPLPMNAIIGGKPNNFNKYFEVAVGENGTPFLKLRDGVTSEQISALKTTQKADLTGYIQFNYYYGGNLRSDQTQRVTVKLK